MRKRVGKVIQAIIIFSILLMYLNLVSAATYYVNNKNSKCSDDYAKSKATNISTPWCNIQPAFDNVASGDTIYLMTGEYNGVSTLQNKDFTGNVKISAYQNSDVNITSYVSRNYFNGSNSLWTKTSSTSNIWKTKLTSSDVDNPHVYYADTTKFKFFTWATNSKFLNSGYSENSWYNPSTKELFVKFSDSSKNPNTLRLYVSASDFPFQIKGNTISSSAYITVSNLNFKYNANGGIHINDQSNVIVDNCNFIGGHTGIQVGNQDVTSHKNLIFRNNDFDGRQNPDWYLSDMKDETTEETSAIFVADHAGRVEINNNNFVYWHGGVLLLTDSPRECNNSEVHHNTFRYGIGSQIEIENYCSNTKYHDNEIFDSSFAGVSFAPADASAGRCEFYNNIIVSEGQQKESSGTSYDNYAIKAQSRNDKSVKNWYIHHNTFYGYGRALNTMEMTSTGLTEGAWVDTTWKDNIFYAETEYTLFTTGLASDGVFYDYNIYYIKDGWNLFQRWNTNNAIGYASLDQAKDSSNWDGKWDIHSKQADPLFTNLGSNDLKPKSGSPACTMSSTGSYVGAIPCTSSPPANRAPTQSKPLLRASDYPDNSSLADLYCYNQSTADADGDRVVNKYRWFRNGTYMSAFNNKTMVGVANTLRFQTWICEVTPNDGKVYGTPMNSSPLYIRAPPTCGDKICNGNENCSTCSADCGSCPVPAYCGDKICNGKENCSTCPGDCGTCVLPKITGCVLEDVAWDENTALKRVYNLSTCFNDPLKTTLTYSVRGNKQITVTITRGIVDFSSPTDWTGVEHVVFTATSGTRSATTNNITLTVNHAAVCGDDVCEDDMGETCTSCASDCGTCPKPKSSGGGGGGGGGSSIVPTTSITDENSNETDNETAEAPSVIITDTFGPDGNIIPPLISEPGLNEEPALTETSSNLETATSLGLEETAQATASAVSEPIEPVNTLSNIPSTNNNLVPIVFVTLALILVAPGIYLISKNHEQLLARLKKVHKVVLYEDDASGGSGNDSSGSYGSSSFSNYFSKIQSSFVLAIKKGHSSVTQLIVRLKKPNKIVYYEDDAPETVHHDYFARLHELVSTAISRGYDKLLVASKLRESGWSEDIIEGVLDKHDKEFVIKTLESSGLDAKHADALHHYVKKALEKGHEWTRIATDLLRVGWTSKVVDCLLKTYCDTSLSFLPTFQSPGLEGRIE